MKLRGRPKKGLENRERITLTLTPTSIKWLTMRAKLTNKTRSDYLEEVLTRSRGIVVSNEKPDLTLPKDQLLVFCGKYHINRMALYGSVLDERFGPESDIDILVEFDSWTPSLFDISNMEHELAKLFGGRAIDLRTAQDLSKHFRSDVVKNAAIIYDA